jgi:hypothetical protein
MPALKRTTIYFEPRLYRALRRKAEANDQSVSNLVNEVVRRDLVEDAEDLETFRQRRNEPNLDFEDVIRSLKRRRKL